MFQNKKQLQYLWIFKPELNDIAKRIAEDHTKWMNETHIKDCLLYTSPSPRD